MTDPAPPPGHRQALRELVGRAALSWEPRAAVEHCRAAMERREQFARRARSRGRAILGAPVLHFIGVSLYKSTTAGRLNDSTVHEMLESGRSPTSAGSSSSARSVRAPARRPAGPRSRAGRSPINENCTGLAPIVGQL
jgi:hypothetical protein